MPKSERLTFLLVGKRSHVAHAHAAAQEAATEAAAARRRVLAAWQANLSYLAPKYGGDTVRDAIVTRSCRVLLLTNKHIVYCKAKGLAGESAKYRVRWSLCLQDVNNVLCALSQPLLRTMLLFVHALCDSVLHGCVLPIALLFLADQFAAQHVACQSQHACVRLKAHAA
jgi:hypothetical protein